jgi:hypothetical protein
MELNRTKAAAFGLLVPTTLGIGMSADTSYRFLGKALQITGHGERLALCGTAESAIVALTVYSWATKTKAPAYLAYVAVLAQAIPAFKISGGVGGPVRVIFGPVLLAVMLHLLLGLDLKMSGRKSDGLVASALRELRERLTAYLGIGRRGIDSAAIARSRAADRAVALADRVASAKPGSNRHARLRARLAGQIDAARHGLSPVDADQAEAAIVARVVRRKSVVSLAGIDVRHDWSSSLALAESARTESLAREDRKTESESTESLDRKPAIDVTAYAAGLLSHEPPAWSELSKRDAVAKADSLNPGLTARELSDVLSLVGVSVTGDSIRAHRAALRKLATNGS